MPRWLKTKIADEGEWVDQEGIGLYVKVYEDSLAQTSARLVKKHKKHHAALAAKHGTSGEEDPAPPDAEFKEIQNSKGGDAIGMLETVLEDTKAEKATTHETEEAAQGAYEKEMTRLTDEERTHLETIASTEQSIADKEKLKEETIMNHGQTRNDKVAIERYLKSIKPGCDFMDENIDARKESRKEQKE